MFDLLDCLLQRLRAGVPCIPRGMAPDGGNSSQREAGKHNGQPTPFAGDITASPKKREKSEPPSLQACARAIFFGPAHTHPDQEQPVKTMAAASLMMSPDETYHFHEDTAAHKYSYPLPKLIVLGILAGAYIGFGYSLCCVCAGGLSKDLRTQQPGLFSFLFGIYGFPTGLMLCVVAGADLYTSNCMYSAIGVWEGRFGLYGWFRMLLVSYFSNLVGALLLLGLMYGGEVFSGLPAAFIQELALKKVGHSWGVVLLRGILGNWLVCLAVWQGNMGRDFAGRFFGVFLPDAAFVSLGLEHCIANMFLIPMAMALGAPITAAEFIRRNLIPATIGNWIGGSLLVATAYACSLGSPGHALQDSWEELLERSSAKWAARRHNGASGSAAGAGMGAGVGITKGMTKGGIMGGVELGKSGRRPSTVPLTSAMSQAASTVSLGAASQDSARLNTQAPLPPISTIPAERPPLPSPRRRFFAAGTAGQQNC